MNVPRNPGDSDVHPVGRRLPVGQPPTFDHMSEELATVLDRVSLAVNTSLDLSEVLERLATLALEVCPAHRASIFLLNTSGTHLVPRTYVAHTDVSDQIAAVDYETRPHFTEMEPIDLAAIPSRLDALTEGRAFTIADLAESPLVPPEVVRHFRARSAIIVPLVAPDEPLGIMTLDWMAKQERFKENELVLLEAIGGYASLAIRNARIYEMRNHKAESLEKLVRVASSLNAFATRTEITDLAVDAMVELIGADHCSLHLVDGISVEEAAELLDVCCPSREPLAVELPSERLDRFIPGATDGSAFLFPLFRANKNRGFLLATIAQGRRLGADEIDVGRALSDLVAAALERADLHERLRAQLVVLEVLHNLSETIAGASDLPTALRQLNQMLVPMVGIELESISLAGARSKKSDATAPSGPEADALRAWRHAQNTSAPVEPVTTGATVLVPIVRQNRVQGVLRVRPGASPLGTFDDELLLSLGLACAEVIHRAALHRDLAEKEHSLAIAQERERIAHDLHSRVGQLVTALGMQLKDHAQEAPGIWRERFEELADQTAQGSRQIKEAIHSLLFLQVRRSGLVASLRDLVQTFEATSGVATDFEVRGRPGNVAPAKEDVLFRVAHEAFTNIRRHSGASWAEMTLSYDTDEVALAIRDHGRGFGPGRDPFASGPGHLGLASLRQRLEEFGGDLVIANAHPHGVLIEARIPLRRKRPAPPASAWRVRTTQ